MVLSLLAYFCSMVAAFAIVMTTLVSFGDSQLRTTRLPHSAVSVIAGSDRDALTNSDRAKEAQKAAEARKALEAQRAAEARDARQCVGLGLSGPVFRRRRAIFLRARLWSLIGDSAPSHSISHLLRGF